MNQPLIYADNNATTPLCPGATRAMHEAIDVWGNPSSAHQVGRKANELLERSRRAVAEKVGVTSQEVVFTSGGSEANTMAIMGSWLGVNDFRVVTSRVEHSSVLGTVGCLEKKGAQVQYAPVLRSGELDLEALLKLLDEFRPHLVSLMTANNETGVLFPIPEIQKACASRDIRFHTDAVQGFGKVPPSFYNQADFVSISAHKIHGPKGTGALIVRSGRKLVPTHYGGSHEIKRRGGTVNMIGIAGFGGAAAEMPEPSAFDAVAALRDRFEAKVLTSLEGVTVQGQTARRLPNTSNLRFPGIASEVMLGALDLAGMCVSSGSACSSGSITPSHVLLAMGMSEQEARECVRVSWCRETNASDVDSAAERLIQEVTRIRGRRQR